MASGENSQKLRNAQNELCKAPGVCASIEFPGGDNSKKEASGKYGKFAGKQLASAEAEMSSSEVIVLPGAAAKVTARKRANKGKGLPSVLRLLGQPPLITGERLQDFEAFLLALSEDLKPGSLCEWLMVCEVAQLKWISARVRRAESGLIDYKLRDSKISSIEPRYLGYAFAENIDYVERTSYLTMEYEKRCDLIIRNLKRMQATEARPKNSQTIELEAEEVGDA